ncbi:MAG: hypothetical protein ACI4F4_09580 [Lachnospiraceae bacterium]
MEDKKSASEKYDTTEYLIIDDGEPEEYCLNAKQLGVVCKCWKKSKSLLAEFKERGIVTIEDRTIRYGDIVRRSWFDNIIDVPVVLANPKKVSEDDLVNDYEGELICFGKAVTVEEKEKIRKCKYIMSIFNDLPREGM